MVHEVYLSLRSNADVKSEWSYSCAPLVYLHGIGRNNFIFYFDISVVIFTLYGNVRSEHNSLSKVAQMIMHDSCSGGACCMSGRTHSLDRFFYFCR